MTVAPVHLMLIDADEARRDLFRTYLKRQGFLVSAARDAEHAHRLLAGLEFDLIVMDESLPDEGICELTKAPVLWLVARGSTRAGDVIEKPFEPQVLTDRINAVLNRLPPPAPIAPEVLRLGPLTYDIETASLSEGDARVSLTATEIKLMRALADRPGAPLTRAELADAVEADPMSRAVDVQITRLRRKLEADPKMPRYLQTVRGTGYLLAPD
ncbi:MAG TPA: DNA-binding response regulator [Maritimibacter sp.]|nr:DNA-binding response regulator [Maritimibacter sp.]